MDKHEQEMEQELIPVGSTNPQYRDEEVEDGGGPEEYRNGRYWRTEQGFIEISEMDDRHLLNARRHALRKAGEYHQMQADIERKAETMLLKFQQLHREAKNRNLLGHTSENEPVEQHE